MEKFPMTPRGFEVLKKELNQLKTVDRRTVIAAIASARELGDLSENAEYHAAREKQGFIEARISDLEAKVSQAEVIDPALFSGDKVRFGATVIIADEETDEEKTYQIVGTDEADIKAGRLSYSSPLAKALIGKSTGDSITVKTPGGEKHYEIVDVLYQ
tara:strand:- start:81 stop:554 length:474 start_codon:yes stop_codon:yes gene_type:complete